MLVQKHNIKWQVFVEYTDLDKAFFYHLPHIDQLVDAILGLEMFSFFDAFFGYHHMSMAFKDVSNTNIGPFMLRRILCLIWITECRHNLPNDDE